MRIYRDFLFQLFVCVFNSETSKKTGKAKKLNESKSFLLLSFYLKLAPTFQESHKDWLLIFNLVKKGSKKTARFPSRKNLKYTCYNVDLDSHTPTGKYSKVLMFKSWWQPHACLKYSNLNISIPCNKWIKQYSE